MSFMHFIEDTPVWVWILLIFLLRRGYTALFDREMRPGRLFFLPVLFLVWGIYGVTHETYHADLNLIMMSAGVLIGIAAGYVLWWSQPPLRNSEYPGLIVRAGTPLTLGMIIVAFSIKFIFISISYIYPGLRESQPFGVYLGLVTGIVDGVFWGGTLRIFVPWYKKEQALKHGNA